MTLNFKTLKPGSMIISKRYNIFKRLWYKLLNKELPYNQVVLFTYDTCIMDTYSESSTDILLEPKRNYTKDEVNLLTILLLNEGEGENSYAVKFKGDKELAKLYTILNTTRSFSINSIPVSKKDLILHDTKIRKNYHVKQLAEEKDWYICFY